jgi:hypothetical protein
MMWIFWAGNSWRGPNAGLAKRDQTLTEAGKHYEAAHVRAVHERLRQHRLHRRLCLCGLPRRLRRDTDDLGSTLLPRDVHPVPRQRASSNHFAHAQEQLASRVKSLRGGEGSFGHLGSLSLPPAHARCSISSLLSLPGSIPWGRPDFWCWPGNCLGFRSDR